MPRHDSLNYASKWDHILDSDDEELSSSERRPARPRVTRLDQPSTITITPAAGAVTTATVSNPTPLLAHANDDGPLPSPNKTIRPEISTERNTSRATTGAKRTNETVTKQHPATEEDRVPQNNNNTATTTGVPLSWTERGAGVVLVVDPSSHDTADASTSSGGCSCYYWSQDRETVTIRIPIPNDNHSRPYYSWNCTVEPIVSYRDRHCAVLSTQQKLVVAYRRSLRGRPHDPDSSSTTTTTTTWLQGTLSRPVHLAHDDEDTIDWTILEEPQPPVLSSSTPPPPLRYLCVTLFKATPMPGLTPWWTQCLPAYEPQEIQLDPTTTTSHNSRAWQQAWEQAHEQFRAKIRAAAPHPT